MLSLGVAI